MQASRQAKLWLKQKNEDKDWKRSWLTTASCHARPHPQTRLETKTEAARQCYISRAGSLGSQHCKKRFKTETTGRSRDGKMKKKWAFCSTHLHSLMLVFAPRDTLRDYENKHSGTVACLSLAACNCSSKQHSCTIADLEPGFCRGLLFDTTSFC